MTLQEKINSDFIEAYKTKKELEISVLRLLKSALKNEEIAKKDTLNNDDVIKVLKREAKQRRDSASEYRQNGKEDIAANEEAEFAVIERYLPAQLDEISIKAIAKKIISESGATNQSDMGKVIGKIMAEYGGEVDGATVSKVVRELLK